MNTTTGTKPTDEGALPERDAKTGRFEKATATPTAPAKPVVDKAKKATTTKPAADKKKA